MSIKGFKDENGNIKKYDIDALSTSFTATVGQVLSVDDIDENGNPIKWKAIDQSSGEGGNVFIDEDGYLVCDDEIIENIPSGGSETWTTLYDVTLEEDVNTIEITTDINGNPFNAKKMRLLFVGTMTDARLNLFSNPSGSDATRNMQNTYFYQAFKANNFSRTLVEIGEQMSNGLCIAECRTSGESSNGVYTLNAPYYTALTTRPKKYLDRIRMRLQDEKYFTTGTRILVEGVLES